MKPYGGSVDVGVPDALYSFRSFFFVFRNVILVRIVLLSGCSSSDGYWLVVLFQVRGLNLIFRTRECNSFLTHS